MAFTTERRVQCALQPERQGSIPVARLLTAAVMPCDLAPVRSETLSVRRSVAKVPGAGPPYASDSARPIDAPHAAGAYRITGHAPPNGARHRTHMEGQHRAPVNPSTAEFVPVDDAPHKSWAAESQKR